VDLGWSYRRCILCGRELADDVPFSRAHLIPDSIGGFAWAWTKCKECNEQVGSSIEEAVIRDDSIICSVDALRSQLPELAKRFDERTRWIAKTDHGPIEARLRNGAYELLTTKDENGARRQDSEVARKGLETRLRRAQQPEAQIEAALSLFDNAEAGVPVEIHGETFTRNEIEAEFGLPFDGEPVTDAFPSLIAFHFLAFAIGKTIYDPSLDALRDAIRRGEPQSNWHVAESGLERKYEPRHLIGIAQCEPHVVVRVQLFGWNVWRVHFPKIALRGEPVGLLFDLTTETITPAAPILSKPLEAPTASAPA
jgi:hypothetical protein